MLNEKNIAVVFLCVEPNDTLLAFAQEIKKCFDVFIVVDSNEHNYNTIQNGIRFIQYDDNYCKSKGFYGCNIDGKTTLIKKEVISIDKFLLAFCTKYTFYDFVWTFEDDVFIPSVNAIQKITKKYIDYDLVTPSNNEHNGLNDWHWLHIKDKIEPPYYNSMVCAFGVSRRMLDRVQQFRSANNQLFFMEALFNTLAMQNNLKVKDAFEFKTIVWMGEWGLPVYSLLKNNFFHPDKDKDKHGVCRQLLTEKNNTPKLWIETINFLKNNLQMDEQIKELEQELKELKAELLICEKQIGKRNDSQKDYLLQKQGILEDISAVEEEINILTDLINNPEKFDENNTQEEELSGQQQEQKDNN